MKYKAKRTLNNWFNEGVALNPLNEPWIKEGDIISYNIYTKKYHKIVNGIQDLYLYRSLDPVAVESNNELFQKIEA